MQGAKVMDESHPLLTNRTHPLFALVDEIKASNPLVQSQTVGRLAAACTIEMAKSLDQVSVSLFDVKKSMAERLDKLTNQMATSSEEASQQTAAMVRWTRTLVWLTGAYTLVTGGLLVVAILSRK
jgi:hypothetical protein